MLLNPEVIKRKAEKEEENLQEWIDRNRFRLTAVYHNWITVTKGYLKFNTFCELLYQCKLPNVSRISQRKLKKEMI